MDDILEDFSDAVSYIRSESTALGISSRNIILMGLSAGGHLALSYAAFNSSESNTGSMEGVRGVIAYYSPSDLRDLFSTEDKSLFARFGAGTAVKTLYRYDDLDYKGVFFPSPERAVKALAGMVRYRKWLDSAKNSI